MPIDKAMELIYNIIHEQSESLTSEQLEALNLGLSALKTIKDFKLYSSSLYGSLVTKYADTDSIHTDQLDNVSRETILGRKLIELSNYNCSGKSCTDCKFFDKATKSCLPLCASFIVNSVEKETKA